MRPAFNCLYHLENGTLCIMEIRRTDLPADADISDVFYWLYIDKQTLNITHLWFRSMDSSGDIEERFFDQGYLKFNRDQGTFIEKFNSAQHQLANKSKTPLSREMQQVIESFLKKS